MHRYPSSDVAQGIEEDDVQRLLKEADEDGSGEVSTLALSSSAGHHTPSPKMDGEASMSTNLRKLE
eukprot:115374-Rhodomonas_salina.1